MYSKKIIFEVYEKMLNRYICYKTFFDKLFAIFVLIALLPLFLLLSLIIKLTSRGPIFFLHKRIGMNNKTFKCIKFRTMYQGSVGDLAELLKNDISLKKEFDETHKLKNDPRITPFGNFLRKTSIDELPQFINVLLGTMSVVGPRPIVEKEKIRYGKDIHQLLSVKPGITGLWQTKGRSELTYKKRKQLDIYYTKNNSFILDFYIIIKTFFVLLFPKDKGAF